MALGVATDYLELQLLDHTFKVGDYAQPTSLEMALSSTTPQEDGSGVTEPSPPNGYARAACNNWNAAASRQSANSALIQFPLATGSWGPALTHFMIYDQIGNPLFYGDLSTPLTVALNEQPRFEVGDVTVGWVAGGWGTWWANQLLNHVLLNTALPAGATLNHYTAVSSSAWNDDGTGGTEPSAGGYARVQSNAWATASSGQNSNSAPITFPEATADWLTGNPLTHAATFDTLSAGNLFVSGPLGTSRSVTTNKILQFNTGAFINQVN